MLHRDAGDNGLKLNGTQNHRDMITMLEREGSGFGYSSVKFKNVFKR